MRLPSEEGAHLNHASQFHGCAGFRRAKSEGRARLSTGCGAVLQIDRYKFYSVLRLYRLRWGPV